MIPTIAYMCETLSLDEETNQDKKQIKSLEQYDILTDPEKKDIREKLAQRFDQQAGRLEVIEIIKSISDNSIEYQLNDIQKIINKFEEGSHKHQLLADHLQRLIDQHGLCIQHAEKYKENIETRLKRKKIRPTGDQTLSQIRHLMININSNSTYLKAILKIMTWN